MKIKENNKFLAYLRLVRWSLSVDVFVFKID